MEFLDNLVVPHSTEHLRLLIYVLALALVIFLPYTGMLIGSSLYSILLNVWGRKKNNKMISRFSKELVTLVTERKSFPLVFGILPLFTVIITYTQLLHETDLESVGFLIIALTLFTLGVIAIYRYKHTFYIDDLFRLKSGEFNLDESAASDEKEQLNLLIKGNFKVHKISAVIGVILLIIAAFIVTTSIQLSFERTYWKEGSSFYKILLSYTSVVKFFYFIVASLALTSIGILFYYFSLEKEYNLESRSYGEFVFKFSMYTGILLAVLLPLIVIVNLLAIPGPALSNTIFGINLLILVFLFFLCHYLYLMIKQSHTKYSSVSFILLILVFLLFVVNDQVAFDTVSQKHRIVLASEYNQIAAKLKETTQTSSANGEEIYNRICSSCHRFDHQVVGPAYNNVVGKYEGKLDQLAAFIENPHKVDPKFPPMPDLGLRPNEAKAAAEFLLKTYKKP